MVGTVSELIYFAVVNNIAPIVLTSLNELYTLCMTNRNGNTSHGPSILPDVNDERELELLQMERLLKWMGLIFEDTAVPTVEKPEFPSMDDIRRKAYKKDLYNIYVTIASDFSQYQAYQKYNASLWVLPVYRNKNTRDLARKILSDVKLYQEGLRMLAMFQHLQR